ncbi:hypothetical protein [Halodesulfovibrio marinisediminis]|uniref:Uncharacterized protein n=1 Tax=Halodesulfovibrio marinisediminis DSM 17456 TaxID=1121457 RepID=A0A1N6DJV6_9BACT|nr:hypothetical protein [Halodesulfovibrio marinisediminis]SIN71072.1 hypothetical protein SAMN02745161_0224 [Halodesulfovibrio marinisediminis DSM 17456]
MAKSKKEQQKLKKRIAAIKRRKASTADDFSDTVMKFCKPLLAESESLSGDDNAIGLGVFAWNASFLPRDRWEDGLHRSLEQFDLTDETKTTLVDIVEEMVRQKEVMYPNDLRVITDYKVHETEQGPLLTVDAKLAKKALLPSFKGVPSE